MELDAFSAAAMESADLTTRLNIETLRGYAARAPAGKPRRIVMRFLTSPCSLEGTDHVEAIVIEGNRLVAGDDGTLRARPTGERERLETGLVFRSIGYVGAPLPGVPFDERRNTVLNDDGRVLDPESHAPLPGVYAAGWVKRGPSGVIGTNKKDAQETTDHLLEDFRAGRLPEPSSSADELLTMLRDRGCTVVDYTGWEAIDAHERSMGAEHGRPRVKLVQRDELLKRAGR
jgi:ferredoxin--NADP+ reductase